MEVYIRAVKYFPILTFYEYGREKTIPLVLPSQSLLLFKMLLLFPTSSLAPGYE